MYILNMKALVQLIRLQQDQSVSSEASSQQFHPEARIPKLLTVINYRLLPLKKLYSKLQDMCYHNIFKLFTILHILKERCFYLPVISEGLLCNFYQLKNQMSLTHEPMDLLSHNDCRHLSETLQKCITSQIQQQQNKSSLHPSINSLSHCRFSYIVS